ncbi:hypothetical protein [Caryophanon latum]|uniref:hypothetical protein n=1 Tax=Caryophanon latum TaxID=33977 RepID=UPI0014717319|nr:hypothetical protein [Caryophanon latum]
MIEDVKRFLHEQQLPIEWLAIQTGLPKRTLLELFSGKRHLTAKYEERFRQALTRKND